MKSILIILQIFLVTALAYADSSAFNCERGKAIELEEGQGILEKVQAFYLKIKSLKAHFVQSAFLEALEVSELSSGTMWLLKPGMMKWHYEEPEEQIFILNNDTLWLYQVIDNQVLIDDLKQVVYSELPVSFLLGLGDLDKSFELLSACSNPEGIVLALKPKSEAKKTQEALNKFRVLVDYRNYFPKGAYIRDVGGNTTAILLSQRSFNKKLSKDLFVPSFPEGVDIQDRRSHE